MGEYKTVVELNEGVATYESGSELSVNIGYVAVLGANEEVVWDKTVMNLYTFIPIPRPFFDKRLAKAVDRAHRLVDSLNTNH